LVLCSDGHCADEVADMSISASSCAVLYDGTLWCWGATVYGLLGVEPSPNDAMCGNTLCRPKPQKVPGVAKAVRVAMGDLFGCAALADGSVVCWGDNELGQLAQDPAALPHSGMPVPIPFPAGVHIVELSAGTATICALAKEGDVYCWGQNDKGQAGVSPVGGNVLAPTLLTGMAHDAIEVRLARDGGSGSHGCAIRQDLNVWCWGIDLGPQAGIDAECGGYCSSVPGMIPGFQGAAHLAVGPSLTCVLRADNTVWCIGANTYGQLGQPSPTVTQTPVQVVGLPSNIASIAAGSYSTFAVTATGDVWGWGAVNEGSLADGMVMGTPCPNGIMAEFAPSAAQLSGIVKMVFGTESGLAVDKQGALHGWGSNYYGQLGHAPLAAGSGDQTCPDATACTPKPVLITGF
jgi:alpha-tubulin suppressor-like RCC1 family protein